jgi:hypothetical protein
MANGTTQIAALIGRAPAIEYRDLLEYSIDSHVLTLADALARPSTVRHARAVGARPDLDHQQHPRPDGDPCRDGASPTAVIRESGRASASNER